MVYDGIMQYCAGNISFFRIEEFLKTKEYLPNFFNYSFLNSIQLDQFIEKSQNNDNINKSIYQSFAETNNYNPSNQNQSRFLSFSSSNNQQKYGTLKSKRSSFRQSFTSNNTKNDDMYMSIKENITLEEFMNQGNSQQYQFLNENDNGTDRLSKYRKSSFESIDNQKFDQNLLQNTNFLNLNNDPQYNTQIQSDSNSLKNEQETLNKDNNSSKEQIQINIIPSLDQRITNNYQLSHNKNNFKDCQNKIEIKNSYFTYENIDEQEQFQTVRKTTQFIEQQDKNQTTFLLKDIYFQAEKQQLIAIVGNHGSGKSSLIKAIFGEMNQIFKIKANNFVSVKGSLSYMSQKPQFFIGTIKQNVIMEFDQDYQQFDPDRYYQSITNSGLRQDLEYFENGDQHIIGDKGNNLTEGQKKRIAFARSIYLDKDIYIFDEPFTGMDIEKTRFILRETFQGFLMEKTKIITQCTLDNLQQADYIYIISDGRIIDHGNYETISAKHSEGRKMYYTKETEGKGEENQNMRGSNLNRQFTSSKFKKVFKNEFKINDKRINFIKEEDMRRGKVGVKIFSRFLERTFNMCVFFSVLALLAGFLFFIGFSYIYLYSMFEVDDKDGTNSKIQEFYLYNKNDITSDSKNDILQFLIYNAISYICSSIITFIIGIKGKFFSDQIHLDLVEKFLRSSIYRFINRSNRGIMTNRLTNDILMIDQKLLLSFLYMSLFLMQILGFLILYVMHTFYFMLVIIAFQFLFMSILFFYFLKCFREISRFQNISKSPQVQFMYEQIQGGIFTKFCCNINVVIHRMSYLIDQNIKVQILLSALQRWIQINLTIGFSFLNIIGLTSYYFYETDQNRFLIVSSVLIQITVYFFLFSTHFTQYMISIINFERCQSILGYIQDEEIINQKQFFEDDKQSLLQFTKKSEKGQPIIEFENVNYSHQFTSSNKETLKNIQFQIFPQEKVSVIGLDNQGKSTILKLLIKQFYNYQGDIYLNEKNLHLYSITQLKYILSYLSASETLIFQASLRQNIDPLDNNTNQEILQVLQSLGLTSQRFQNLNFQISFMGSNLSKGEKIIINLARQILKNRNIYLFDKIYDYLDKKHLNLLENTLKKKLKEACFINVHQNFKYIQKSDQVIYINNGKISEQDELRHLQDQAYSLTALLEQKIKNQNF